MHLKHTCLPISPPEQVLKLADSISHFAIGRQWGFLKFLRMANGNPSCHKIFARPPSVSRATREGAGSGRGAKT